MELQESDVEYIGCFSRLFIFELWLSTSGSDTDRSRQVSQRLIDMVPDVENVDTKNLDNVINYICQRLVIFWKSSKRTKSTILIKHSKWLNETESVKLIKMSGLMKDTACVTSDQLSSFWKFFKNPAVSAEITGIQQCLIERCGTLLECMSSGYKINTEKFEEYAIETAKQLVTAYPWYHLPSSVHKVLLNGAIVIENAMVPIGELSKEAAESTNKNIKAFRLNHTRKMSRVATNTDLMNRLLLNWDPLITSSRKLPRKKKLCCLLTF